MKVLAVVHLAPSADLLQVRRLLGEELRGSWKLFSQDIIREAYLTDDASRIVFVLEAEHAAAAETHLKTLPLVKSGSFTLQLIELRPFTNWERLFAARA
jgi:hypothetical protein